jgi:hypothetical protein
MDPEARALCEYVRNVVDEALHDLDSARRRGRKRLHAMLTRCANVTEYDSQPTKQAKPNSPNPWLQFLAALEPVNPLPLE